MAAATRGRRGAIWEGAAVVMVAERYKRGGTKEEMREGNRGE